MRTDERKLFEEIGELLALHYEDWQVQDPKGPEVAFGRYLRSVRQVKKLTIAEVAVKADVAESELLAYEHGLIPKRWIKERSLTALAHTLDEEIDTFLLLLEADMASKAVPTPTAGSARNGGHRFYTEIGKVNHRAVAPSTGEVASCKSQAVLEQPPPIKPLPVLPTSAPRKQSFRQVLGDPLWQLKIYRIWTPVVTLLLFFCLQVQARATDWAWQPATSPSFSAAAESMEVKSTQLPNNSIDRDPITYNPISQPRGITKPEQSAIENLDKLDSVSSPPTSTQALRPINLWKSVSLMFALGAILSPQSAEISKVETVAPIWQTAEQPLPIVHMVGTGEVLACISNHYYAEERFYPFLCLYSFGNPQCSGSLRPGNLIEIPVFEDFQLEDPQINQALSQLPNALLNDFKNISRDTLHANQTERLRGIDYFCQTGDYQEFGEELVLSGKIPNPADRIPGWSSTGG